MAKRPLYDLLPRNSEIHNFTSLHLTDRQKRIIGLGKFEGQPDDSDFNPRLYVKSTWYPPREGPDLEDKLHDICKDLRQTLSKTNRTGREIFP